MTDRLLVATSKGLFVLQADGKGGWTLGEPYFVGEPVSMVLPDPRDGSLYAALNLGHFGVKLHRRRAGAADWEECAVPVYPLQPADETGADDGANASAAAPSPPATPWTLQQIWSLETGGPDEPGVLWAGTIPGGLFRSDDGGDTWALNRALWDRPERRERFGGGYDAAGIHSVMVDPRESRRVTIGVPCGGVRQTDDGGATWRVSTEGMEATTCPRSGAEMPTCKTRTASCNARRARMCCGHSITARASARPTAQRTGSGSKRNHRASGSRLPCIRASRTPRDSCPP